MTSLNTVHRIGDQISETLHVHEAASRLRGARAGCATFSTWSDP